MLRKLGLVIATSAMLLPLGGRIAMAAPAHPVAHPTGWIQDFCKDSKNWDEAEELTGRRINSRGVCISAMQAVFG